MTVTILDDNMTSDCTPHMARRTPGTRQSWEVSWLRGRHMDRNSAITAMSLADLVGSDDIHAQHRLWLHVEGWAAELTLTAPQALTQIASPPTWGEARYGAAIDDPEAAG